MRNLNLFFTEICNGSTLAYAGPCLVEPEMDNRPYAGIVN